jgi:molybdopterin-guanine dinucleotide biosynthesis protein A
VADAIPGAGPLAGIVAGLERSSHDLVAVLAVDMPFASAAMFRFLASKLQADQAVVPVTDRGPEPLHAVYACDAAPALRSALEDGTRSVIDALSRIETAYLQFSDWHDADPSGRFATNVNRPEDLADTGPR